MLTVACVLRSGGDFDESYVLELAEGIRRNLTLPHELVCLTDVPMAVSGLVDRAIPLLHNWPSWWSKMEIFRLPGPTLYFDLDTVITGNIDRLGRLVSSLDGSFMMLRGFYSGDCCSGIMAWNGDLAWLYRDFAALADGPARWVKRRSAVYLITPDGDFRGDQDYISKRVKAGNGRNVLFAQDVMPGIYSYKVHVKPNGMVPDSSIICYHGRPRPHEATLEATDRIAVLATLTTGVS